MKVLNEATLAPTFLEMATAAALLLEAAFQEVLTVASTASTFWLNPEVNGEGFAFIFVAI